MGKNNKKGPKANVFKVAGAKSLKKSKAKAVNLGLKNLKQKVQDIDTQFLEINNTSKRSPPIKSKSPPKKEKKPQTKKATAQDVAKTVEQIVKMDL